MMYLRRYLISLLCLLPIYGCYAHLCSGKQRFSDAIVVLGQNTHSSYDSSHPNELNNLLASLQLNYVYSNTTDILVWHEEKLINVGSYSLNIRFCRLNKHPAIWGRPHEASPIAGIMGFSPGYLKMIRFYSVTVWETLDALGYDWMMRFDDDSQLLSPIRYNIFDFMRNESFVYGYRMLSKECGGPAFSGFVDRYVSDQRVLYNSDPSPVASNASSTGQYCDGDGSIGFYNNFYISEVAWWLKPRVQRFLYAFDRSGLIFSERDNDLILQTAAVRLFAQHSQRYKFTDWSYRHHTIQHNKVSWGGLEIGTDDVHGDDHIREYVATYYPAGGCAETNCTHSNGAVTRIVKNVFSKAAPFCDGLLSSEKLLSP